MMKFIVTAGSTSEKVDQVRKITNMATGKLGSLIASELYAHGENRVEKIYYVCEKGTISPDLPCLETVNTCGVIDLKTKLEAILASEKIDAVIHSMAVSDYTVGSVTTAEKLSERISSKLLIDRLGKRSFNEQDIKRIISEVLNEKSLFYNISKIPSGMENLILTLQRTPKIIHLFKELQPEVLLVGFKLLSGVPKETLLKAGFDIMKKNRCDLVFANDAESLKNGGQSGYLLFPDGTDEKLDGKPEIARRIAQTVLKQLESR